LPPAVGSMVRSMPPIGSVSFTSLFSNPFICVSRLH
jgi:hypothetical protein